MLASSREQKKKSDCVAIGVSLGCFFLWPIAKQRGEMNPTPATKTIKRLYYYSVTVLFILVF